MRKCKDIFVKDIYLISLSTKDKNFEITKSKCDTWGDTIKNWLTFPNSHRIATATEDLYTSGSRVSTLGFNPVPLTNTLIRKHIQEYSNYDKPNIKSLTVMPVVFNLAKQTLRAWKETLMKQNKG